MNASLKNGFAEMKRSLKCASTSLHIIMPASLKNGFAEMRRSLKCASTYSRLEAASDSKSTEKHISDTD